MAESGTGAARDLYAAFHTFNRQHFGEKLGAPLILITQAASSRTLGDYVPRDVHGLESRIRIAPAAVKRGELFARDVLLHEMIHAAQHELTSDLERGYRGHGPEFAKACNRIGSRYSLPAVGVKGRDGLPDCAHWPMSVRPEGYYPEPYEPPKRRERSKAEPSEEGETEPGESSAPTAPKAVREWLVNLLRWARKNPEAALELLRVEGGGRR